MKNIFHVENLLKQQQPFIMVGLSISASQPQDLPIDLRLNRSDNKQSIEQIQPIEKVARLRRENNGESASLAKQVVDCGQGLERAQSSRSRTLFSDWQLACLEWRFTRNKYLTSSDRRKVAELLHLRQVQVKTWFQNRRMKWKRQILASGATLKSPTKPKGRPKKNSIPPIDD